MEDPTYRDVLTTQIGKPVIRAFEEPGKRLVIELADGVKFEISLDESDRQGPEAAMLQEPKHNRWMVWP